MTTALLLFASTFVAVFALVLQSLNVNGGHRVLACITSLFIGAGNLVLFKTLPGSTDALQLAGYLLGGPVAVLVGMWAHPHLVLRLQRLRQARADRRTWWEPEPQAVSEVREAALRHFARRLLDPEDLGHLAHAEIRAAARIAMSLPHVPQAVSEAREAALRHFTRRLLDPEDLGHLAHAEIRAAARIALDLRPAEPRP